MTAEDRELLAHAIWTTGRTRAVDRFPLADALMPVVEAIARRRAAEELRAFAEHLFQRGSFATDRREDYAAVALYNAEAAARRRADELTDREETL